jgi:hypothetical protein
MGSYSYYTWRQNAIKEGTDHGWCYSWTSFQPFIVAWRFGNSLSIDISHCGRSAHHGALNTTNQVRNKISSYRSKSS